jgi:Family of unknown function (DUF6600)
MTQETSASGFTRRTIRRCVAPALAILAGAVQFAPAQLPDVDGPPGRVARISAVAGGVSLQAAGDTTWSIAPLNYSLTTGDRLFADASARAEFEIGSLTARIGDAADVTITNLTDGLAQFGIAQGTMRLTVYRLDFGDTVEIDTPNGAITVRDPGHYRVEVPANAGYTLISVDNGAVDIEGPGMGQTVRGQQTMQLFGYDPASLARAEAPPLGAFDAWSADRDAEYRQADCGRYMSAEIPGCADLRHYGRWADTPQYGFVWYPPPGIPGWTPYRMGHWVWVEPWGWVWVAAEPWGFAPYHYGRWATIGGSWAWVPGPIVRPVYSPALVAFVGDGRLGVSIQGWFPLGPRDPFIPWYHYGPRYLRRVNAANVRGVHDIDVFVRVTDVSRIRYAHRDAGLTAVSRETFRSGHRVDGATVHVRGGGDGRVQSHPPVMPTGRAAAGGAPATAPPVGRRPPMIHVTPPRTAQPRQGGDAQPPVAKPRPPETAPAGRAAQPRSGTARTIITKRPLPPQNPPFTDRAKVMKSDPGRPLDPQQMKKLREARPAAKAPPSKGAPGKASPPATGSTGKAAPPKPKPKKGRGGGGGGGGRGGG